MEYNPYVDIFLSTLTDKNKPYYSQIKGDTGTPGKDSSAIDVAKNLMSENEFLNNLSTTLVNPSNPYYKQLIGTMGPTGLKGETGTMGPVAIPSTNAIAQSLLGLGNTFTNNLAKTIISSSTGVDFANNVANAMSTSNATAANTFATFVYNQLNDSVGNSFVNNVQYSLMNNNNFKLSLADSLTNDTTGNKLAQLLYNNINNNTGSNTVFGQLHTNLQGNSTFANSIVNTMLTNITTSNTLSDLIYNKINNTPTAGNTVISKLAYNLATNPDYQYVLQGPPGNIADPESLRLSLTPKTLWCSTTGGSNSTTCKLPPISSTSGKTIVDLGNNILRLGNYDIYSDGDTLNFIDRQNGGPSIIMNTGRLRLGNYNLFGDSNFYIQNRTNGQVPLAIDGSGTTTINKLYSPYVRLRPVTDMGKSLDHHQNEQRAILHPSGCQNNQNWIITPFP